MNSNEQFVSNSVLKGLVPVGTLTDEQLDLLVDKSAVVHLFKGQMLFDVGETASEHVYLLHGSVQLEDSYGRLSEINAGDDAARQPLAHEFPRRSKVTALSDCSVLKIESELVEKLLCWGQVSRCLLAEIAVDPKYADDYFWIKKLLQSNLFFKVPPTNIQQILDKFSEVNVVAGERIIQEGDEGTCCYLVKTGIADVQVAAQGDKTVAELGPGTVFGEDALVTNNPRNASIVMQTDGVLMKLEKQDFYSLVKQPAVTMVTAGNIQGFLDSGAVLLDVRTQKEFETGHYVDAINLPLNLASLKSAILDQECQYITCATTDERAKAAAFLLSRQGFKAYAMQGGISALPQSLMDQFTEAV